MVGPVPVTTHHPQPLLNEEGSQFQRSFDFRFSHFEVR